jgi:hypothetical protein
MREETKTFTNDVGPAAQTRRGDPNPNLQGVCDGRFYMLFPGSKRKRLLVATKGITEF